MRIVRPFRSFSVARGCARVDSTLDTAKLCSDRRVDVDRPWLRAVLGEEKRFYTAWSLRELGNLGTWFREHQQRGSGAGRISLSAPMSAWGQKRTSADGTTVSAKCQQKTR